MNAPVAIKVGQLEISYVVDGSASGGIGMFELTVPQDRTCRRRTAMH